MLKFELFSDAEHPWPEDGHHLVRTQSLFDWIQEGFHKDECDIDRYDRTLIAAELIRRMQELVGQDLGRQMRGTPRMWLNYTPKLCTAADGLEPIGISEIWVAFKLDNNGDSYVWNAIYDAVPSYEAPPEIPLEDLPF